VTLRELFTRTAAIGALVLCGPLYPDVSHAASEQDEGIAPGTRIRLSASQLGAEPIVGTLLAIGPEALSLELSGGGDQQTIPRSAVTRLEVSRGLKSQAGRGALVGLAVGGAATMLLTFGDYSSDVHGDLNLLAIGAGLAAGGAAIGGLIGWAHKAEQWEVATLQPISVAVGPVRGRGVGVTVRLAWGRRPGRQR